MESKGSVVMIIAPKDFRDEELFVPKELFERQGLKVTVACSVLTEVVGMLKGKAQPHILLENVKVADYDVVVFVGGMGAQAYYKNAVAHQIAKDAVQQKKILAAICLAPNILANAGLLEGKEATCWDSENLTTHGARYQKTDVVRVGRLITGSGPQAAKKFGETILAAMKE